ncbi:MAG: hypothetical protein ACYC4L_04765 [Chloroflexota bacterium]
MATTQIATRPSNLPTLVGGLGIEGMEDLGQADMILPRRSIIQPTSDHEGAKGTFFDNVSEECVPRIHAVILRISRGATKWGADLSSKTPECRSYDGLTGTAYGACNRCQFNAEVNQDLWDLGGNDAKTKRCSRGYEILAVDTADQSMFLLGIRGMSVKPLKGFITKLAKKARPPFTLVTGLGTEKHVDAKGNYFTLTFDTVQELTPEEAAPYREQSLAMKGVAIKEVEEEPTEAPGEGPDGQPF